MLISNTIASFALGVIKIILEKCSGFPPTSGQIPPTSGNFDWLNREPHVCRYINYRINTRLRMDTSITWHLFQPCGISNTSWNIKLM